ncbi:MAG: hypothetical protein AAGI38_17685 [Bacteroidota bacterium]
MKASQRTILFLGILLVIFIGCSPEGQSNQQSDATDTDQPTTASYTKLTTYQPQQPSSDQVEMKEIRDPNTGMVNQYIPLPISWKLTQQGIEGPGGALMQELPGASFGNHQRYIQSVDDILQQDIKQLIQRNGGKYLGTIDLPEVAKRDERLGLQYWQAMPMEKDFQTKGVEARDREGKPSLIVVHYTKSSTQYAVHHAYFLHALTSTDAQYERDKKTFLFALANLQSNPEAVTAFNKKMQEDYLRRERIHAAKMKQSWDHFNAWNRNHIETWKEINEGSMDSWRKRDAMTDAIHERSVDGILERERFSNPFDGKELEVDAGYKHYYTNSFGEVIGSNDEFFNPQQDPSLNHQEWRKVGN